MTLVISFILNMYSSLPEEGVPVSIMRAAEL